MSISVGSRSIRPGTNQTVDADPYQVSDSSLEGVSPFDAFLPDLRVMGKLEIEPLELR